MSFDLDFNPVHEEETISPALPRPHEIVDLSGTFGKAEVQWNVEKLLAFFKLHGKWCSFDIGTLRRFYEMNKWNPDEIFFGLVGGWYDDGGFGGWAHPPEVFLVSTPKGMWMVTDRFINRCAKNIQKRAAA